MPETKINPCVWQYMDNDEKLEYLLMSNHLSDCSFVVGSDSENAETFACHKYLLAQASPFFERMLYDDIESNHSTYGIRLYDILPSEFRELLHCIYLNNYESCKNMCIEALIRFHYIAEEYMVLPLQNACVNAIKDKLKIGCNMDFGKIFKFAWQLGDKSLMELISSKLQKLDYARSGIYDMDSSTFYEFLKATNEILGESERFNLLATYFNQVQAASKCQVSAVNRNKRSLSTTEEASSSFQPTVDNQEFESMLGLIDYEQMTVEEFCNGPGKSNLFNFEQKYKNLAKLCHKPEEEEE